MITKSSFLTAWVLGVISWTFVSSTVFAANTYTISDPQEVSAIASGYDVKDITFTLNADWSMTAEIFPYGVAGDTDGDGDPNASTTPGIVDDPGVGPTEYLEIDMECGATDVSNGCVPNVIIIYTDNTLQVYNLLTAADLTPLVNFTVLNDRYVMTITDLLAFKTALGIPTTAVNFGAFNFVASFLDDQPDDLVPDTGNCEAVHLDPPVTATCDLQVTKTASVSTVGPLAAPVGNEREHDDSDDIDSGDMYLTCGCKGKVDELVMQYNGGSVALISVDRTGPFGTNLFSGNVAPGGLFTVAASDFGPRGFKGTLGVEITLTTDGANPVSIHTSCSEPIGPGLVVGDFTVISGGSKKLDVPLCEIAPVGCPANQQVTYTYVLTNNGTDLSDVLLVDDKMPDPIAGPMAMAGSTSQTYTRDACLYETTTNIATATGTLGDGETCSATPASVTVEMLVNPPPPGGCSGGDSDSDSGHDGNYSGDSDDSDADSGTTDCDGDSDFVPPPIPPEYHGCGPDYWSDHKKRHHRWGLNKPDDRFDAVFGVDASGNKGLHKVLKEKNLYGKGAASKQLQRQAAAAMLNATNPDVNYFYTPGEIIAIVNDAYANKTFDDATRLLKMQNELGCPLAD